MAVGVNGEEGGQETLTERTQIEYGGRERKRERGAICVEGGGGGGGDSLSGCSEPKLPLGSESRSEHEYPPHPSLSASSLLIPPRRRFGAGAVKVHASGGGGTMGRALVRSTWGPASCYFILTWS